MARQVLLKREFRPDHAQLEFGAVDGSYPDGEFGSEPLVASDEKVVVATLPEFEGNASPDDAGTLIYDGVMRLATADAEVGTVLGGDLQRVPLEPGEHRLKVFVNEPGYASRIVFLVTAAPH